MNMFHETPRAGTGYEFMKDPNAKAASILMLLLAFIPASVLGDDGGGRSVFATGAGNRALALGGAYAAVADDPSAAIWNPAGLGLLQRKELHLTQTSLFGLGFSEQYASFVIPNWRWGTVATTWRRFGVDGIEGRDERGFLLDDELQDAETELLLGYGRCLLGGDLSIGGAFKVRHHNLAGYADSGFGLDLGLWMHPLAVSGVSGRAARSLALGISLRNALEPRIKLASESVSDPIALRTGLAWKQPLGPRLHLLGLADLEKTREMDSRIHAGIEASLDDLFALRLGTSDGQLTAGAGISWKTWGADYQFEDHPLGSIHRFGISLAFGPTVAQNRLAAQAAQEAALRSRLETAFTARSVQHQKKLLNDTRQALSDARWEDALAILNSLLVLAPDSAEVPVFMAEAWLGLARHQESRGDALEAALSLRRVLSVIPDHEEAAKDLQRVQQSITISAQRTQEIAALWESGFDALGTDDLEAAESSFSAIIRIAPQDREAASMLEYTERLLARQAAVEEIVLPHWDLGAEPEASSMTRRAPTGVSAAVAAESPPAQEASPARPTEELTPARRRDIDDLYRRGLEAMQAERRTEAMRYWEIVLTADPAHERARKYLAAEYLALGMEFFVDGSLREAVTNWQQAVRVDPTDPRATGYLERALEQLASMQKIAGGQ